ncbi:MAG: hypothetical protein ABIJ31_07075, partial [Pseudomonadota bacterium]
DTGHARTSIGEISHDPYTEWAPVWEWGNGVLSQYETTSSQALMTADIGSGAVMPLDADSQPLHTTHKQYPDVCGPTCLNMVITQLDRTDRSPGLSFPRT